MIKKPLLTCLIVHILNFLVFANRSESRLQTAARRASLAGFPPNGRTQNLVKTS
jgi:hypothetical protein